MPFTVVSFHAHPDDETLYTGGTLARAAAEGHRVVLVTATSGGAGLADSSMGTGGRLARRRLQELQGAAQALGVARTVQLGYADSGMDGAAPVVQGGPPRFCDVPVEQPADRLARILVEENAHVLTGYDAAGGYGHPDHVRVHRVAVEAARAARTPVLLQATVDRERLRRAIRAVSWLPGLPQGFDPRAVRDLYTAREDLTHRVDVRSVIGAKRAALVAHASQATADSGTRTIALLLRLPRPLLRAVLGAEWFVEVGREPSGRLLDDVFTTVRAPAG
jgi:LmbE family N-acetylglucosaminyl deacetylase